MLSERPEARCEPVRKPALPSRPGVRSILAIGLIVWTGMVSTIAHAQQDRERAALRRVQQQLSKLQQDNAALQREKADLEQKLKAAETELAKAKGQVARLGPTTKALAAADQENEDLQARLEQTRATLSQTAQKCQADIAGLQNQLAESQSALERAQQDSAQAAAQLQASLQGQTGRAEACEAKNLQLFSVTEDLIRRYKENRGAWERFLLSEPFTQLKSVQVENLLEDMHEKAQEARVETSSAPTAPQSSQ